MGDIDPTARSILAKRFARHGEDERVHTAADIARLLALRSLPSGRGGLVVWLWIAAVPLLWLAGLIALVNGEVGYFWGFLAALMTARAISGTSKLAADARAALSLPELDREWLGALIDGLTYPSEAVRAICRLRLTTLLPTLDAADAKRLSQSRRALLFENPTPLMAARQPDFLSAVLHFGAAAGDEQALGGMDQLANMRAFTAAQRRVRDAARYCLPILEKRVAERAAAGRPISREPRDQNARPLTPEARALLDEIEGESGRRPGMRFGFLVASWGVIVPYALYQTVLQWRSGSTLLAFLSGLFTMAATQLYRLTLTPYQALLANRMASVDDVRAVGPLAEMMAWPDDRIRSIALAALTRLLPRMRSSDTQLLSADQRALLYETLKLGLARQRSDFQIALLSALEQVGDVEALPHVRSLAAERPRNLRERRVVEAANTCLPYLEACAQQNRNSQTLLRPFTNEMGESNLLRPAGRQIDSDSEMLVRPITPSEPT